MSEDKTLQSKRLIYVTLSEIDGFHRFLKSHFNEAKDKDTGHLVYSNDRSEIIAVVLEVNKDDYKTRAKRIKIHNIHLSYAPGYEHHEGLYVRGTPLKRGGTNGM